MKRILTILPIMLLAACSQQEETSLVYDTAGTERRTLEVAVSSAGIVEPLASYAIVSRSPTPN
jgi:hypothetical protein